MLWLRSPRASVQLYTDNIVRKMPNGEVKYICVVDDPEAATRLHYDVAGGVDHEVI